MNYIAILVDNAGVLVDPGRPLPTIYLITGPEITHADGRALIVVGTAERASRCPGASGTKLARALPGTITRAVRIEFSQGAVNR